MQVCPRHPIRSALLIVALLAALTLAACGGDSGGSGPDPATVAPADAPIYFDAVVRPEGSQKDDLDAALGKLLNSDDPGGMIRGAVESSLSDQGLSYADDVEPWLGQRMGAFVTDFKAGSGNGAVALAVTDKGAAEDAIKKAGEADAVSEEQATYEGVTYTRDSNGTAVGIVGDFLVAGTEPGLKAAVDASQGSALADDTTATDALDGAPESSIFRAYFDTAKVLDLAVASGAVSKQDLKAAGDQLDNLKQGPVVLSGAATADSLSFEASGPAASGGGQATDVVSTLPGDSWFALGLPMIGETIATGYQNLLQGIESGLSQVPGGQLPGGQIPDVGGQIKQAIGIDIGKDLGWAGDMGAFVKGSSLFDLGGGIVIETDDEQAASATVDKLRKALARQPDLKVAKTNDGFTVQSGPAGAQVAIRDGKVVIALAGVTVDDVLSPSETLADNDRFKTATDSLGEGMAASLFVDFPTIVGLAEGTGQTASPSYQQIKPYLDALDYLVAGSGTSGDRTTGKLVLGLKESGGSSDAPAASIVP